MAGQLLSKVEIVAQLQDWHQKGVATDQLWRQERKLTSRAVWLFGSWRAALQAAGFESQRQQWSRGRIVSELRSRGGKAGSCDAKLRAAAVRYFGSMQAARKAAGLPSKERQSTLEWTRDSVLETIQNRVSEGKGLAAIGREAPDLYSAAKRLFGSWKAARGAAGYPVPAAKQYTLAEVVERIQTLYRGGVAQSSIRAHDADLYRSAVKCFGSWHQALLTAGVPPSRSRRWSKQRVIQAIRQRHEKGHALSRTWREDKALFRAGVHWFGNWEAAMKAAGFQPIQRERWSQQRVIERLQVWRERTRETNLRDSEPSLAGAATRLFGSLQDACTAADVITTPRFWTDDRVIAEIQERYVRGEPRHIQGLGDLRLAHAAKRRFGSWECAVAAAGLADRIPIRKPLKRWTKELVIESIQEAYQGGTRLGDISRANQSLYNAAKTHFGSWRAAVREAGLPTTRRQWTKALIIEEIAERHSRNASLSSGHRDNINLAAAASRHFGSWTAALVAAGVMSSNTQRRQSS